MARLIGGEGGKYDGVGFVYISKIFAVHDEGFLFFVLFKQYHLTEFTSRILLY